MRFTMYRTLCLGQTYRIVAFHELWRSNRTIPGMGWAANSIAQSSEERKMQRRLCVHIYPPKARALVLAGLRRTTRPLQSSRCLGLMFGVGFGRGKDLNSQERNRLSPHPPCANRGHFTATVCSLLPARTFISHLAVSVTF